jgi:hypothetical protein
LPDADAELTFLRRARGRASGEERVELAGPAGSHAHGLWFAGRPGAGLHAWADLVVDGPAILAPVAARLGPGGALMVAYHADATERALRRRVPPAATPLGLALIEAGCRWLKDWSFAEGGREGATKLQGTVPLDRAHARDGACRIGRELEAFVQSDDAQPADRDAARAALAALAGDAA